MHISLETPEQHAIEAYSDAQVQISSIVYTDSLIVSKQEIITDVKINTVNDMSSEYIELLLKQKPEIILIGHTKTSILPPVAIIAQLSQQGIGMEFMFVGAACRTYNVLLSEARAVTLGIIF